MSNIKFKKIDSFGLLYPGTAIRNPERNESMVRLFKQFENYNVTPQLKIQIYDAGIKTETWDTIQKNISNKKKIKHIDKYLFEFPRRGLIFIINGKLIFGSFAKGLLNPDVLQDELTIKYLIGNWFPNPTTSAYKNRSNAFYLTMQVIKEINKRITSSDKPGIYRQELIYILMAKTNNYMAIVETILKNRQMFSKKRKSFEQLMYDIDYSEYPQLVNSKTKTQTIISYTDGFARYLNLTNLFEITGCVNPLINISSKFMDKVDMLIDEFKKGTYTPNFDSFKYVTYDTGLFTCDEGEDAYTYWENIYNISLPWSENDNYLSCQERSLFEKTFTGEPTEKRIARINNQLEINKRLLFLKKLEEYGTTFEEVLYNPTKYASIFSKDYEEPIKRTSIFEGVIGLYLWDKTRFIDRVSVIINTKIDDNGIPTCWASGTNLSNTGEDIRILLPHAFINIEPSLLKYRAQKDHECSACTKHLMKVRQQCGIDKCYSILVVSEVSPETASECFKKQTALPVIPMCLNYFMKLVCEWQQSNDPNYLLNKLDEIANKPYKDEEEFLNEMNTDFKFY